MIAQVMDHEDVESDEKFDRTLLFNSEAMLDSRRFDERDYQCKFMFHINTLGHCEIMDKLLLE